MPHNRHAKLASTIFTLYCTHWQLFWRIMLPVAIVAIPLHVAQFFQIRTQSEDHFGNIPASNVNTISGIELSLSEGITWKWEFKFQVFEYTPLILMILTICPLSLAVAGISRASQVSENAEALPPPTAREMWRRTGHKALTVFMSALLFILIVDAIVYLFALVSWLMPSQVRDLPYELYLVLITVPPTYFMVMLSLYNQCLILEDNSLIGIFRRSHALVSGARWRFLGIYILTGWVAAVIASVLMGTTLLLFSLFVPELAQVRAALSPLRFLTLFIGADIEVVLLQVLGVRVTAAILIVRGLIVTFLVPIWAILTTHLYLLRVRVKPNAIRESV